MRGAQNVLIYLRHLSSSKLLVGSLFALAMGISGGALLYQQSAVHAASCSNNDIIRCGVSNGEDFRNKMNQNASGDLPAIYSQYGINADEVATRAIEGTAYKDGTIHADGRVVATNVMSLGRSNFSYAQPVNMGGKTYYQSTSQDVFNSNSLSVLVVMDDRNQFKYALIKDCANPAKGNATPPPAPPQQPPQPPVREEPREPLYECTNLRAIRVSKDDNEADRTYRFELSYRTEDGATLQDADFDFGDGEVEEGATPADGDDMVASREVTYTTPGEKNITSILNFSVNGDIKPVKDDGCATTLTIPKPNEITICRNNEKVTIPENERLDTDLPANSEECQPAPPPETPRKAAPPALPSTGPAEVISGTVGLGSLAGASYYFRASRRNLFDSIFKD